MAAAGRKSRWSVGGLFLCLVLVTVMALFSDCFAWRMGSSGRPLAERIRTVFRQEAEAHSEVMRREEKEAERRAELGLAAAAPASPAASPAAPPATPALGGAARGSSGGGGPATYGFYFPVFQEVTGTLNVVGMVRRFYGDSPIHLLQDGGNVDFSAVCRLPKYNCSFEVVPAENSRWNPHSWFERMLSAAKRLATTYVIYLEPDVLVRHRHIVEPQHDAGGMYDNYNSQTSRDTLVYLERRGRERSPCFTVQWRHFGLAGGSYFRTEALLDAFDPRNVARLDFRGMEDKEGGKAMSSDFAMLAALASRGWTVYPWPEASQKFDDGPEEGEARKEFRRNNPAWIPEAAFEHAHKEHYGHPLPREEEELLRYVERGAGVTCHGCVWRSGPLLERKMKIPSKPPRPPNEADHYTPAELRRLPLPKRCRPTPAPGAAPLAAPDYEEFVYADSRECGKQARNFGRVETVRQCDELTSSTKGCGSHFMFAPSKLDWACRCCAPGGQADGPGRQEWNVYVVQTQGSKQQGGAAEEVSEEEAAEAELARAREAELKASAELEANAAKAQELAVSTAAEPEPTPAAVLEEPSGYKPSIYSKGRECETQAKNFGFIATAGECDKITAADKACGGHFMFSFDKPSWACRCCTKDGPDDGPESPHWNVLTVQSAMPKARRPEPPKPLDPGAGLPKAEGERPGWLLKEDGLVIDARKKTAGAGGGVLILQAVLMDRNSEWGKRRGRRPRWLRAILAANREHARQFGHAMVLRWAPSEPQLTTWQWSTCKMQQKSKAACVKDNERENFNWEKHLMMAEYLNSPENFSHVFMLDADAALVRPDHDTLSGMAAVLEEKHKDVFLSDEDWLKNGKGRINGGLILVKNTVFTRNLFNDTFDAHKLGRPLKNWRIGVHDLQCTSNEQICLNDLFTGGGKAVFAPHALLTSGRKYNRGGCVLHACGDGGAADAEMKKLGMSDPDLEIMHFMGGSKSAAAAAICEGPRDLTGGGPEGYGCRQQ